MRNVFLVAKREYQEQIRGRAFKVSTVLVPLLMVALLGASYLSHRKLATGKHIAIAAENAALGQAVRREILNDKDAGFTVDLLAPAPMQDRVALFQKIQSKAIDGILILNGAPTNIDTSPRVTYSSQSAGDMETTERLKYAVNRGLANERLTAGGMKPSDADDALKEVSVETLQLDKEGKFTKSNGMAAISKATAMAFLITMPILLYGMDMARSIIEEKSSRIFEVMLSVVQPDELLTGKLLGTGAVGLTQIVIWVMAATLLVGSSMASSLLTGEFSIHLSWMEGLLFPVYFLLGFFLFCALFSGLAATCETAQELQMYTPLAAIPVWLSFGMLPVLLSDPNSIWSIAASIFPLTAPYVMLPRLGLVSPPLWQIALSLGLLMLSIWAALWFSSRLYRVGILMYGKRATLPEMLRWLRQS